MKSKLFTWVLSLATAWQIGYAQQELLGAGATFPYPLYSKMFNEYHKIKNVKVNYQSIGSGGGVKQIFAETVDFGASDGYVEDKQLAAAPRKMLHIPIVLGAVTVTYNLPGVNKVKLNASTISDIFMGKITKWNDPKLQAINSGVKLPDRKIVVVHRSDGSGTTSIFTDYLAKVSPEWKTKVGAGKSVSWPTGLGAKGNEGVSGLVRQMPGAIGYVELAYTIQNKMSRATIQNKAGEWVDASLATTSAAAAGEIPADTRINLTNPDSKNGYPISGFTWLLVYEDQKYGNRSKEKAQELAKLLWWMVHEGQQFAEPLDYSKLPADAVKKTEALLKGLHYGGEKLLP